MALAFSAEATPARGAYPAWELELLTDADQIVASGQLVFEAAVRLAWDLSIDYRPPQPAVVALDMRSAPQLATRWFAEGFDGADRGSVMALARLFTGDVSKPQASEPELYRRSAELAHHLVAQPEYVAKIRSALARLSGYNYRRRTTCLPPCFPTPNGLQPVGVGKQKHRSCIC